MGVLDDIRNRLKSQQPAAYQPPPFHIALLNGGEPPVVPVMPAQSPFIAI